MSLGVEFRQQFTILNGGQDESVSLVFSAYFRHRPCDFFYSAFHGLRVAGDFKLLSVALAGCCDFLQLF